jgi:hypothetical protein
VRQFEILIDRTKTGNTARQVSFEKVTMRTMGCMRIIRGVETKREKAQQAGSVLQKILQEIEVGNDLDYELRIQEIAGASTASLRAPSE